MHLVAGGTGDADARCLRGWLALRLSQRAPSRVAANASDVAPGARVAGGGCHPTRSERGDVSVARGSVVTDGAHVAPEHGPASGRFRNASRSVTGEAADA